VVLSFFTLTPSILDVRSLPIMIHLTSRSALFYQSFFSGLCSPAVSCTLCLSGLSVRLVSQVTRSALFFLDMFDLLLPPPLLTCAALFFHEEAAPRVSLLTFPPRASLSPENRDAQIVTIAYGRSSLPPSY